MDYSERVTEIPAGTVVPQELLEEMLWIFRVEDGKWWGTIIWGMYALNTKHKQWTLAGALTPPHTVTSSSTAGCTFPPRQGQG